MLTSLSGKWALVLGASSGIGRAVALGLAEAGMNVVGVHFDTAEGIAQAEETAEKIRAHGVQARFANVNAARETTRSTLIPEIAELTGGEGLRVLLHSLAFGSLLPMLPRAGLEGVLTRRQLEMTMDVMAHSLVYWTQDLHAAALLRPGAKVFAMTSAGGVEALPSYGAVSAAKSALESHVRQLACELAEHGVAVNALRAGTTDTPALRKIPEHAGFIERAVRSSPSGRTTEPTDVADAVITLAATDSSWVTGNIIGVDGAELPAAAEVWGRQQIVTER